MERKPRTAGDDLSAALLVFAVFAWELLVLVAGDPLLAQGTTDVGIWHQLITAAGWGAGGLLALWAANRTGVVADLRARQPRDPLATRLVVVVGAVLLAIGVRTVASGEIKIIGEVGTVLADRSDAPILAILVLLVYYLTEALVIVMLILFAQRAGVRRFGHARIPWGGLLLALTWGVMHCFLQGPAAGIYAIFASVLYGVIVVYGPNRIVPLLIVVAAAFII